MKLDILGAKYDLEIEKNLSSGGHQCYGLALFSTHKIIVDTSESSEQRQAATVLHEVIHSILAEAGHAEHQEEHVVALGSGLVSFLRNNPAILPVLLGKKTLESLIESEAKGKRKKAKK